MAHYLRFLVMIVTSTVVMFCLTYLNSFNGAHLYFSQTRAWMAVMMGSAMTVVMLVFMWRMYRNRVANIGILAGSAVLFAASLWLVRSQSTVDDVAWMRAMIPHHSIAILTSERAKITDPRVRELADGIIRAQKREIIEMQTLIADLDDNE